MARRDASIVQLDFPQLVADLITTLRLTGALGVLNLSDTVIPVISVGDVRPPTFSFTPVTFSSGEIVSGFLHDAPGNTVIADNAPLVAGTYDLHLFLSNAGINPIALTRPLEVQHRNAANTVTLAVLLSLATPSTSSGPGSAQTSIFGYVIGSAERLRVQSPNLAVSGGGVSGIIYAAIRPTP